MAVIRKAQALDHLRHAVTLDLGDLARQGEQMRVAARSQADKTITEAQAERRRLIAEAAGLGREQGLKEGREQGLAQGLAQGREAALQEYRSRLDQLDKAWAALASRVEAERAQLYAEARHDVVRLAVRAAEKIVKRAIRADAGLVRDQVAAVLDALAKPTRLTIRLHPEDEPLVREALPGLMAACAAAQHIELTADATVSRGSAVASTAGGGVIDAGVETQLERIAQALLPGGAAAVEQPAGEP